MSHSITRRRFVVRTVGLAAGIDLAPSPDGIGKRGFAAMEQGFHKEDAIIRCSGDTIALTPPLIVSEAEIEDIFARVARVIRAVA